MKDQEEKQKIEELKQKKKEMQAELDEMQGHTAKGKAACVAVFLFILALLMSFFTGMVKLDVGGVASEMLAPVIGDVPVLRSILPSGLQRKTLAEQQAEEAAAQADSEAAAEAQMESEAAAAQVAQAESEAAAEEAAAQTAQAESEAAAEAEMESEAAAEAKAQAESEAAAALQDYVDTYSAMKPKDAAKVFDSMMPDQEELIVKILENLKPDQRAAILSKMSVTNAADLTTKMEQ